MHTLCNYIIHNSNFEIICGYSRHIQKYIHTQNKLGIIIHNNIKLVLAMEK